MELLALDALMQDPSQADRRIGMPVKELNVSIAGKLSPKVFLAIDKREVSFKP